MPFRSSRTTLLKQSQGTAQGLARRRHSLFTYFQWSNVNISPAMWTPSPFVWKSSTSFFSSLNYSSCISNLSEISPGMNFLLSFYVVGPFHYSLPTWINVSSLAMFFLLIFIPHVVLNLTPSYFNILFTLKCVCSLSIGIIAVGDNWRCSASSHPTCSHSRCVRTHDPSFNPSWWDQGWFWVLFEATKFWGILFCTNR